MRIGLLTEGGYPYVSGDTGLWCDRLVRGLAQHEFDVYALSRSERQEDEGWLPLPPQVSRVRTAPLWTAVDDGVVHGRRTRRRFAEAYGELAAAVCGAGWVGGAGPAHAFDNEADRFGNALYALAELARDEGGLVGALRSEAALNLLERACRAPGALRAAREARVPDLLTVAADLERALRPLSLDWYEDDGLGSVDLCHAATGGSAALTGLLARHFSGVPLLVTEYGVRLRAYYLTSAGDAPVRALLASFRGQLAAETYRQAACVTPGNAHARRWQERCGAESAKIRIVHPGLRVLRSADVAEAAERADCCTLVWVGRIEPEKDLICLLHALAEIRRSEPRARLRIIGAPADGPDGAGHLRQCEALAACLFPDKAEGEAEGETESKTQNVFPGGGSPVSFEAVGDQGLPGVAEAYAAGSVVVLSSVAEDFPVSLVEAMLCGRATVSTDVGAVAEVIGGTGLVVPPRSPQALAAACTALLRDPKRRARLGAAARARALELFTVERNIAAFSGIYLEIISRFPVRRTVLDETGGPLPFGIPAEARVPWRWTQQSRPTARVGPRWAVEGPVRETPVGRTPATAPAATTAPAQADAAVEADALVQADALVRDEAPVPTPTSAGTGEVAR
ncbi:DUF3492 domain-containing protein [Streptomyces poonensis]|uniref:D-inositol 3-phosphate glycosyltransferase n=1 Tax=Streptomyces poonensis TaxID=68255 RepID=A0A918UBZ5_9ACTN|nr:DUF3492 domain-containing protein [Streptomyces poonensis]GGY89767.1 transferase [Streptomyces poonensis]GLJ88069.1 transferase [Streptomyces poonensis]